MFRRGQFSWILRHLRLVQAADCLRFWFQRAMHYRSNRQFRRENPGLALPPDYLIYESFRLDYKKYYSGGEHTARWLAGLIGKYAGIGQGNLLDWGCGPGRIIRHMPGVLGSGCRLYATDYNARSIDWCRANLSGVAFHINTLHAELPYPDDFFRAIYGISIFTHLSALQHQLWYDELMRVMEPGGVLLVTTQGDAFRSLLVSRELHEYDAGNLVVRGNTREGHRTWSAFHPPQFMHRLFARARVLEHQVRPPAAGGGLQQDVWIVQKI